MIAEETNVSKSKQIRITASQSELQKISSFFQTQRSAALKIMKVYISQSLLKQCL